MKHLYGLLLFFIILFFYSGMTSHAATAPSALRLYMDNVIKEGNYISESRKQQIRTIAMFIKKKLAAHEPANLMFICTHNSRRSHLSQIWASAFAALYDVRGVYTFSAGTEVTTFNERAVKALQRAGLMIHKTNDDANPVYAVQYANDREPITMFSKRIQDISNPRTGFCAVMNCSEADSACPHVPGAELRVSLPYEDPKHFDGTTEEAKQYDERCRQIAREMAYLFAQVKENIK